MSIYLENLHVRLVEELKRVGPPVIAKQTGIARATVYNWMEKGNVPMDKLALLETAGADVNYILTGQRSGVAAAAPVATPAPAVSAGDRTLLENFHAAPAQVQAGIKTTLGAFAPTGAGTQRNKAA